ncbi:MAG TPA: tetratricopeptide repeat protein [Rugosimonospora sp.]|nr:tetratricopeptide repeat protein [Rugosimonospora sp.]
MPESPTLLAAWQQADALSSRGNLPAARDVLEPAAEVAAAAYGPDHPDVLETAQRLALVFRGLADWSAARRVLEDALAAGLLRYGDADPLMLSLSAELGIAAEQLGNRHEARRNFTRVAQYGPAVLGRDHPYVRSAQAYLGGEAVAPVYVPPPREEDHQGVPPPPPAPPRHRPVLVPEAEPGVWRPATEPVPGSPARFEPPAPRRAPAGPPEERQRVRVPLIALTVVAAAGLLAVAVFGVLTVLAPREPAAPPTGAASVPVLVPPADVRLRDDGGSVTLTWKDPGRGTLPFIVSGGRAGEQSHPYPPVPPGQTSFTVSGLNANLDYCFTVVAVYTTDQFAPSDLVCTRRGTPTPGRS